MIDYLNTMCFVPYLLFNFIVWNILEAIHWLLLVLSFSYKLFLILLLFFPHGYLRRQSFTGYGDFYAILCVHKGYRDASTQFFICRK
jgi:predicted permease